MDFSLKALVNHFLLIGLAFLINLFISKSKKKPILEKDKPLETKSKKSILNFIKSRYIRFSLLILYIIFFIIYFNIKKISFNQLLVFAISLIIFFLFFKLKKTMGIIFSLLIISIIIIFIMFNRSLYLLFKEEKIGRIKITDIANNKIILTIYELKDEKVINEHKDITINGDQFGVFCYQMIYDKWINFLGFDHKFYWSSVFAIKFEQLENNKVNAKMDIYILDPQNYAKNHNIWEKLEKKELLLPGVRTVQKIMIIKLPVKNKIFSITKHKTGQITIEHEK